jgi:hypothetical protein
MRPTKPLEDLIIAVFFSKCSIHQTSDGREVEFSVAERKIPYLLSYLERYKIKNHLRIDLKTGVASIKESVVLEKLLREWTKEGLVTAIDPRFVGTSTFLLWILLFGRKTKRNVAIDTNLSNTIRKDIPYYFEIYFKTTLYDKGSAFYIKPYFSVLAQAIQTQRPAIENLELNYLLPEKEVDDFKKIMKQHDKGMLLNGD